MHKVTTGVTDDVPQWSPPLDGGSNRGRGERGQRKGAAASGIDAGYPSAPGATNQWRPALLLSSASTSAPRSRQITEARHRYYVLAAPTISGAELSSVQVAVSPCW